MITAALIDIFHHLQRPESRAAASHELAGFAGAAEVLLFGRDEEIGAFLPAAGLPQTLREGARWQVFLQRCCAATIPCREQLPALSDGAESIALGLCDSSATAIVVLLGGAPDVAAQAAIVALLPLLGTTLCSERALFAADGHAQAAREASRRTGALNTALESNRKALQQAIERAEHELASRRAAETLLCEGDRRKDDFLAMLAHELRNPLAPISMAAKLLSLCPHDGMRVLQSSQIITRQVHHLTHLLDDLLDVSRVTRGLIRFDRQPLDLNTIVADAVEQNRPLIEGQRHRLTIALAPAPCWIDGDRTRLVQVLTNLLNNAARFTAPGGAISLRVEAGFEQVTVHVCDNGIGIDASLLPHVFDLFTQGERSSDRTQGGLGLGLALVKSLVEHHGGTVGAHSAGGGLGAQFRVRLPCLAGRRDRACDAVPTRTRTPSGDARQCAVGSGLHDTIVTLRGDST